MNAKIKKTEMKICKICGKEFEPNRPWQKYHSEECRKEGKRRVARIWKKKNLPEKVKNLTLEQIKENNLYNEAYENILNFLWKGNANWSRLFRESQLGNRTFFNLFITRLCELGVLNKENNNYCLTGRHIFEPLKLRQKHMIENTNLENSIFRPSAGYSFSYYHCNISNDYLEYSIKKLDEKIKKIEEHLIKAGNLHIHLLAEARDFYVKDLWTKEILNNEKIPISVRFYFAISVIVDTENIPQLYPTWKTPNEMKILIENFKKKAFINYLQKKYSSFDKTLVEKLFEKMEDGYKQYEVFFSKILKKIKKLYNPSTLEHMIVIDFLGTAKYNANELKKDGYIKYKTIDRNKRSDKQIEKLLKESDEKHCDKFVDKDAQPVDEKISLKTPFFENFFKPVEEDLKSLGFNRDTLKEIYTRLDEKAEIIQIHSLPDDPGDLLQEKSSS